MSTLAALDLGSNSFHLVLARVAAGEVQVVDRVKEPVRLAAGLGKDDVLDDAAFARGISCLERLGHVMNEFAPEHCRVVGTNTLRRASNRADFAREGSKALGVPLEIISGIEEARLVYLGVAHAVSDDDDDGNRLVIDIGGGSTECIIGEGFSPLARDSLYMGCVSYTERFFSGDLDDASFAKARLSAAVELEPLRRPYRTLGWTQALGSSGTIGAINALLRELGRSTTGADLDWLQGRVIEAGSFDAIAALSPNLKRERAAVLPGGLAILGAVFDVLSIESMTHSHGALREGILYDLLGRLRHEDRRDHTIRNLQGRFQVDKRQAARVERTAAALFAAARDGWKLDDGDRKLLIWACRLHEIGLAIAYRGHHKHGAYLLRHADMAGFSIDDQVRLAAVIRNQRRRTNEESLLEVPAARREATNKIASLLRVARLIHRSRRSRRELSLSANVQEDALILTFPDGWLDEHPLTRADLRAGAKYLSKGGLELLVR